MTRTSDLKLKAALKAAFLLGSFLLFAAVTGFGQQTVNLTAGPMTLTMPDGSSVPMWGYTCGAVSNSGTGPTGTCNYLATGTITAPVAGWSPVVITVPVNGTAATSLTISLTNNLSFASGANKIPTSIMIVGQVGGGLGDVTQRTVTTPPDHTAAQSDVTWFIAHTGGQGTAPLQSSRVQSFGTEVPAGTGTAVSLTWPNLAPGTYLLESGTHPSIQVPMGLIGVLVVTQAPTTTSAGVAYGSGATAVSYGAEVPLEFSEIDPVQNRAVQAAVNTAGFSESATYGTYSGASIGHITVNSAGSGYTTPPAVSVSGGGITGVLATANIDTTPCTNPITDPTCGGGITSIVVNNGGSGFMDMGVSPQVVIGPPGAGGTQAVATAEVTLGTNEMSHCGEGITAPATACYPPVVNYTPFYYLINGVAFNKTNANASLFGATDGTATGNVTGNVLVRMVNAGSRMHVPSIVGSQASGFDGSGKPTTVNGFALVAEDGNPLPGAPRVQTDVFMAAGKTYDVMISPVSGTACSGGPCASLPVFDRQLSLSGNSSERDAGMLAYIGVNGSTLPAGAVAAGLVGAKANADIYNSVAVGATGAATGAPFVVSDISKGVIANDINVYGVQLLAAPINGTLTCGSATATANVTLTTSAVAGICENGTFTYTPKVAAFTSDSFTYCANGTVTGTTCSSGLVATVTLNPAALGGAPVANNITYTANTSTFIKIAPPGVLSVASDPSGFPLTVNSPSTVAATGATVVIDANGGFTANSTGGGVSCPSAAPVTATCASFTYQAVNAQGTLSSAATVTVVYPQGNGPKVTVVDSQAYSNCQKDSNCIAGLPAVAGGDYRWIIEEDKTFYVDPNCTTNPPPAGCPQVVGPGGTIPNFGTQFHTSHMEQVAQGCTGKLSCESGQTVLNPATGAHVATACDIGNGACDMSGSVSQWMAVTPDQAVLDPSKRYYISVLPGDAANPFNTGNVGNGCTPTSTTSCPSTGHSMGGAPIPAACNPLSAGVGCSGTFAPVTVLAAPTPFPTGKLSVMVFEDDFPLNGEQDAGGGVDVVSPNEPGLGSFNIVLWDTYGGFGDVTGQDTYDAFNQPLSNSLAGTIDPVTGLDACPLTPNPVTVTTGAGANQTQSTGTLGIQGMIVTCPKYESDNQTLSPLAGQAVIANLMPDKFSVQAYPAADRIGRGEEWIQTNTLDGQHAHDSFIRIGEPSYFQEFGPAGYHVSIGFANPKIINNRLPAVCAGAYGPVGACDNTITGQAVIQRMSRTPDQRLYPSGSPDRRELAWTQCWVSLGDPDAQDFMFTKCDANGNFTFTGVPGGNWRLTIGDQWNDQIIDGLSTPANVSGGQTLNMGQIGVQQWQANVYTKTFIDDNKNGIPDSGEIGIPLINTIIYYRNGSRANGLATDFNGVANFNETFPLFNWYTVTADDTRYKTTGIHTVYDAGGPADGSTNCGTSNGARPCGLSTGYSYMANTYEAVPLPSDLSVPGAAYCVLADCSNEATSYATGATFSATNPFLSGSKSGAGSSGAAGMSTGRIDPPWVMSEGWTGLTGQGSWIEFGKAPFASCDPSLIGTTTPTACTTVPAPLSGTGTAMQVGENGGIHGTVTYNSTRPFDDATLVVQQPWEPLVPHVTMNLYQEGLAADGVTATLKLVDTTQTSSWDDWAQGFRTNGIPNMNCPGQGTSSGTNADLFFFTLANQPNWLDYYNNVLHGTAGVTALPYNSQYKCYDSMHIWSQLQPAPYDGAFQFPSVLGIDPATGLINTKLSGGVPGGTITTTNPIGLIPASMPGTNCTVCVANPDSTDHYRFGTPMLPPGKYVVEVVMPAGYEVEKEEDKNLLIGDNFIAPVTQQFSGLGANVFIMPDQASVASLYDPSGAGYNPNNAQNATYGLGLAGGELNGTPGYPGQPQATWPCKGEMRVVPDYLSLFPQALEVAPFAGATRPLCDRREIVVTNQMSAYTNFGVFTTTHIAANFAGGITDDFTSEFDPFSPQFGEKFAPPNMPVSTRDYLGNEISRVYSDHFGLFNGLTFSSWEVNPPNITGYSPSMMVQCMNDPGPIPNGSGGLMNDPLFNSAYSDFCYEEPYMPGLTGYLDTPVVPTQGFIGAGYNNPDCAYSDGTPAVAEVDGDAIGPWVSAAGNTLTITALGDQMVDNDAYAGPSSSVAPFNQKKVSRHYGFGSQCTTATAAGCSAVSSVTIGGVSAPITSWSDTTITVTVPGTGNATNATPVPNCTIQQQAQYQPAPGGPYSTAQCGQLLITAGNGKQSIDSVTVTVGGKPPVHVPASGTIQSAIDAALPGDLIIVDPTCSTAAGAVPCAPGVAKSPSAHMEMVIMWKPVRLQGVGAATTVINANSHPAGMLLDPWRRHVNCLFGLTLQGAAQDASHAYDPTNTYSCPESNWVAFSATTSPESPQVDRVPSEALLGWDATLNGNLAEQLQEPSLMGAYEGAAVTVVGRGVELHGADPWTQSLEGEYPAGSTLLTGVVSNPGGAPNAGGLAVGDANPVCAANSTNPYPSNFLCNPSSIDGLGLTNSSQGGGGIFVHGWAHFLQIANNRVYNNAGTLTGGISIGQGEFGPPYLVGGGAENLPPGSCSDGTGLVTNQHMPWCLNLQVNVHNNMITNNASLGDELATATLSGGGGATFCTGDDYYKFNFNWVCGNVSAGEGGGLVHFGETFNGDIEHNTFALNQSINPTIPTNGGGIMVQGVPDTDPVCPGVADTDCPSGLSDGTGPGLVINANLIQGNSADSGAGGGIRLQQVNGTEVATFAKQPQYWHDVTITNNIINNNVAGWDGAGISLQDALNVNITNNTIAHNDTLASSGVLTQSIGTPQASAPAGNCVQNGPTGPTSASCPQASGVASTPHSSLLTATFGGGNTPTACPAGQPQPGAAGGSCLSFSNPILANNIIWQNRSFYIGITGPGTGTLNQQNLVGLFEAFSNTPAPNQASTGACAVGVDSYWDIGVRGDSGPTSHLNNLTLNPTYSILSSGSGYASSNSSTAPPVVAQYCNGSRVPPECSVADGCGGPHGFGVPPGIADALTPNPVFSLTPSATVDEGNNWINVSWGPLSLTNPSTLAGSAGYGAPLANYSLNAPIDTVPISQPHPLTDFFGNARPEPSISDTMFDPGAVEFGSAAGTFAVTLTPSSWSPSAPNGCTASSCKTQVFTLANTGSVEVAGITAPTITGATEFSIQSTTCGATLAPGTNCTITVQFAPPSRDKVGTVLHATLTVGTDLGNQSASLTGTVAVLTVKVDLSPAANSTLAFGNVLVGATSPSQTVMVTNDALASNGNLVINSINGVTGQFNRTGTCVIGGAGLAPGASCTIIVTFNPTSTGAKNATLTVAFQGPATPSPVSYPLSGTGVRAVAGFSGPTGMNTGGRGQKNGTITVTNTGTYPLTMTAAPAITGTNPTGSTYSITTAGTCSSTTVLQPTAPGNSCTIAVQYNPPATGTIGTANLTVTITDTGAATTTQSTSFNAN